MLINNSNVTAEAVINPYGGEGISTGSSGNVEIINSSIIAIGRTTAISGTVKNDIEGTGWEDIDGTGDGTVIEASESGQTLNYKKVQFIAKPAEDEPEEEPEEEPETDDVSGTDDAVIDVDGIKTSVGNTKPIVNGLKELAEKYAQSEGKNVLLKLVVSAKGECKVSDNPDVISNEKMYSSVKSQFKDEEKVSADVLNIDIESYIENSKIGNVSEPGGVIEIAISYDFSGKYDLVIVREHGSDVQTFRELTSKPTSYEDGTFFADRINNMLYIYSSKFSKYVVAYSEIEGNAQNRTSSGGSSGSTSSNLETILVYRLFNKSTGEHLYTANKEERDNLLENYATDGWTDEGVAFRTAGKSGTPVYRIFDTVKGEHFYTIDSSLRDAYVAKGCRDEGIAWYAFVKTGRKVYKLTDAKSGKITYTTSQYEADILKESGFTCEEAEFEVY